MSRQIPLFLKESKKWKTLFLEVLSGAQLWLSNPTVQGKDTQQERRGKMLDRVWITLSHPEPGGCWPWTGPAPAIPSLIRLKSKEASFPLVARCVRLCDPMDCSTPGFPVLHHLPEFAQIHVLSLRTTPNPLTSGVITPRAVGVLISVWGF